MPLISAHTILHMLQGKKTLFPHSASPTEEYIAIQSNSKARKEKRVGVNKSPPPEFPIFGDYLVFINWWGRGTNGIVLVINNDPVIATNFYADPSHNPKCLK